MQKIPPDLSVSQDIAVKIMIMSNMLSCSFITTKLKHTHQLINKKWMVECKENGISKEENNLIKNRLLSIQDPGGRCTKNDGYFNPWQCRWELVKTPSLTQYLFSRSPLLLARVIHQRMTHCKTFLFCNPGYLVFYLSDLNAWQLWPNCYALTNGVIKCLTTVT